LEYSSIHRDVDLRGVRSRPQTAVQNPLDPQESFIVSDNIKHVSDDTFEDEVINADEPVLVDYWAEWCGPCKMIDPLLHELADEYAGRVKVAKVNIDENQQITSRFKIRGIPTLMVFNDGKVQGMKVGAVTKGVLKEFVEEHVG
jgi:thioredoxin 1